MKKMPQPPKSPLAARCGGNGGYSRRKSISITDRPGSKHKMQYRDLNGKLVPGKAIR